MSTYSDEIEKNANLFLETTLQELFRTANFKLRSQENYKEKGIDFNFEIETRDLFPKTLGFICLQNKGTETKIKPLKRGDRKGLISHKLDGIRHIEYWCREMDRPFVFTLCDLKTKTIYWIALQLEADYYLEKAAEANILNQKDKRRGKSIQIYLDPKQTLAHNGEPCQGNFNKFSEEIELSKDLLAQQASFKFDYEKIDKIAVIEVDRSLHILDQVHYYLQKRFNSIKVLHHGFWALAYPFKTGKSAYFEYHLFSLFTDNPILFEIFESFTIKNYKEIQIEKPEFFTGVKQVKEKLLYVLSVLNRNLVFNITLQGKQKSLSIKYIESSNEGEDLFALANLRFDIVLQHLLTKPQSDNDIEAHAFLHYQVGNYNQSAQLYLQLLGDHKNIKISSKHFLIGYNLAKLENFVRYNFSNEKPDKGLLNKLKEAKTLFENSRLLFENDARLTRWIKQRLFFWEYQSNILEEVEKLREFHSMLQRGGLGSNSFVWSIYVESAMLVSFMDVNNIVCDFQSEYNHLNEQVTEAFLMSYSIDESLTSRLEEFDDWHVKFIILYCKSEPFQKYLSRYNIHLIKYKSNTLGSDRFMQLARNFFESSNSLTTKNGWEESWRFVDLYRNILGNLLILSSYLELEVHENLEIAKLMRRFFDVPLVINYSFELKYFNRFLVHKGHVLGNSILTDFFNLIFQSSRFHKEDFISSFATLSEKGHFEIDLDEASLEVLLSFFHEKCSMCGVYHDPSMLVSLYNVMKFEYARQKIKETIIQKLNEKYDWRLYYLAAIYGILSVDTVYFEKLIDLKKPEPGVRVFGGHYYKEKQNRDSRLGAIINLCLKYNIDLTSTRFDHYRGFDPYYDWVMDMKNFDYSRFKPRWITEYATTFYMKEMSKIKEIWKKTLDHIDNHYDHLVIWHLLKILRQATDDEK